jgi:hypothetical protein
MKPARRAEINRENARNSTGPITEAGKQKSALNGFKHGLTGQRMILQDHEAEPYRRLSQALHHDYRPKTEIEFQLVQHIVDCNMRLNRIAAIDSNLMNIGVVENTRDDAAHGDITETVIAQTRAWVKQADSFEKLGRYEARISRQLLQYMRELDRIQTLRRSQQASQTAETKTPYTQVASFRRKEQNDFVPRTMTAISLVQTAQNDTASPDTTIQKAA